MTAPHKTHKQRIQDLRNAAIDEVAVKQTPHRLALLRIQPEFDEIGEEDNYKSSLFEIVKEYGETGITVARLRLVLPEQTILNDAKKCLISEKKISEEKRGVTLLLKVVPGANYTDAVPSPEATEAA